MTDDERIYVRFRGRTLGPLTAQKVHDLIRRGQITRVHELSGDGLSWSKAEEFGDFFAVPRAETTKAEQTATNSSESVRHSAGQIESGLSVNAQTSVEPAVEWYAHVNGENQGPISLDQLRQWKESGRVQAQTLVWQSGLDSWQPAEDVLPEIFGTLVSASSGSTDGSSGYAVQPTARGGLSALAHEMDRRRGWAFFFAIVLIVLSSFVILGQLATIFVAASGSAAGANTVPALIGGIVGIAFAGTVMTVGILILQYCGVVKEFALRPTDPSALMAARRLSAVWSFTGIASLIWLVILMSFVLVAVSIGLSLIEAFS